MSDGDFCPIIKLIYSWSPNLPSYPHRRKFLPFTLLVAAFVLSDRLEPPRRHGVPNQTHSLAERLSFNLFLLYLISFALPSL